MLKTQVQELEANKIALTIEVEKEKVNAAYDNFYRRAARSIRIPGFRQGKAPKSVIAKFIGPDSVREQVEEELVQEVYPQAIKETKLHPVSRFEVEDSNLKEGEPFTFKAIFEVRPQLGDFNYKGFTTQVQHEIVDDESVDKVIKQLQEQYSKTEPVEEGELQNGDYFSANVEVACDGEVDEELSDEKATHKFDENDKIFSSCKGMKVGETREFEVKIDNEDEKDSKYFGKTLNYKVTLSRISRPTLPELNDEFAKSISNEFESFDGLKNKIREDLEERAKYDAEERAFDATLDQIMENYQFDVPESMIQSTIDFFIQGLDRRWRQYGTTIQDYLRNSGKDVNEFRETFRDKATRQTKIMLLIDAIGDRENIEVTDADYREEIEKRAKDYGMPVEKLLSSLAGSEGEDNVKFSLRSQKIRDFLLKNNQINYDMVKEAEFNKGETDA
ncbi:MAG: trigger factor [Clostridiales bacterium]|jgi:trigger factor|nr:trigger factor [Clostridiales bacterium]MDN5281454.1 trigger factor [Candidatus Ozemobacter sp.]